ncbi:hypothetical protein L7F22_049470 [Adiantum nelumboides]|nr:hypothetical protein [Adiantum nelumboides]
MYSKSFLTLCPGCKTVGEFSRIHLNSEVLCTSCSARFRAEENYVDIEDTHASDWLAAEETELHGKGLQEGIKAKGNDTEVFNNVDRQTSFGTKHHVEKRPLEWTLVSSKGLQEEISTVDADLKTINNSVRQASFVARKHHKEKPVGVSTPNKACTEVSSRELGWPNDSKMAQGNLKSKKRKHTQSSATWGVALRKPFREKRKVKSYSPSRESGFRKRGKLGLEKGSGMKKGEQKKYRKKKQESERSQEDEFLDGCVVKDKATTHGIAGKPSELHFKGYFENFKNFMTAEIKRQVLEGLGEASKKMVKEIQVVEVEELLPMPGTKASSVAEQQEFMAQVKLITTLRFPITLTASDGSPVGSPESPKSREGNSKELTADEFKNMEPEQKDVEDEFKDREKTKDEVEDMKEPDYKMEELEPEDVEDEFKDREKTKDEVEDRKEPDYKMEELEPEDVKEPEPLTVLTPCEKSSDQRPSWEDGHEIDVPDSEFFDFESNKSEDEFVSQQIWASYDTGLDMMPRDYVQIKKVVSIKPFMVHIAVLEPAWFSELGNPLSCGEFSAENKVRVMDKINGFSHLMRWQNGPNGMIHIYPDKKEVWALYKDWKESDQEKRINGGYDIVQVVGIDEDLTVSVVPLVNHKGSKTVFQKREREGFKIHKKDFNRFSHQIPTFEIIGCDGVEGCIELDPAAIPSL